MYIYWYDIKPYDGEQNVFFKKGEFLIEKTLGNILEEVFKGKEIYSQYKIKNFKSDYFIKGIGYEGRDVAIEFDGFRHYNDKKTIFRDIEFDNYCIEKGIQPIRIPYYIQYHTVIPLFFGIGYRPKYEEIYYNGFIDQHALRPIDFSVLGLKRFAKELRSYYKTIREDVLETMTGMEISLFHWFDENDMPLGTIDICKNKAI